MNQHYKTQSNQLSTQLIYYDNFKSDTKNINQLWIISFNTPVIIQQVRIPRSNQVIHDQLPKIKNNFQDDQFNIQVYYREINCDHYKILINEQVQSNKELLDIIFPVTKSPLIKSLLIKADFNPKTYLVIYGQISNQQQQESFNISSHSKLNTNGLIIKKDILNIENIKLTRQENKDDLFYIDPELLFNKDKSSQNEYLIEKWLTDYEQFFSFYYQDNQDLKLFNNEQILQLNQSYTLMYQDIKSYLKNKKQYYKSTCQLNKQTLSNIDILNQKYVDFCIQGLQGKIDGIQEQTLALKNLRLLAQKASLQDLIINNTVFLEQYCIFFSIFETLQYGLQVSVLKITHILLLNNQFSQLLLENSTKKDSLINNIKNKDKLNLKLIQNLENVERLNNDKHAKVEDFVYTELKPQSFGQYLYYLMLQMQNKKIFYYFQQTLWIVCFRSEIRELNLQVKEIYNKENKNSNLQQSLEMILLHSKTIKKLLVQIFYQRQEKDKEIKNLFDYEKQVQVQDFQLLNEYISNKSQQSVRETSLYLETLFNKTQVLPLINLLLSNNKLKVFNISIDIFENLFQIIDQIQKTVGGANYLINKSQDLQLMTQILNDYQKKNKENSFIIQQHLVPFSTLKLYSHNLMTSNSQNIQDLFDSNINIRKLLWPLQIFYQLKALQESYQSFNFIYRGLFSFSQEYELLDSLISALRIIRQNSISSKAFLNYIKEPYMFETILQIIRPDDEEIYNKMKHEILLTLEIIYHSLLRDNGRILNKYYDKLNSAIELLKNLRDQINNKDQDFALKENHLKINNLLFKISSLLNPIKFYSQNNEVFQNQLYMAFRYYPYDVENRINVKISRIHQSEFQYPYDHLNLLTQKYWELKSFYDLEDKYDCMLGYFKFFSMLISKDIYLIQHLINWNVFDLCDQTFKNMELILSLLFQQTQTGKEIHSQLIKQSPEQKDKYIQFSFYSLRLLKKKLKYQHKLLIYSNEQENIALFQSLFRLLCILQKINPKHIEAEIFSKIMELEKENNKQEKDSSPSILDTQRLAKLFDYKFSWEQSQTNTLGFSNESLQFINKIIKYSVQIIKYWSSFPGSFVNIVSEHLFYIMRNTHQSYLGFLAMSLFISQAKLIKFANSNKEIFRKNLRPLFFDPVKIKKKSNLVIAQKYGACRQDSQFDLFVAQNGFSCTIEYLINQYVFFSDEKTFVAFFFFVQSLIEWKEYIFVNQIFNHFDELLIRDIESLKLLCRSNFSSPRIPQNIKTISRILEFIKILSSSGIFKSVALEKEFYDKIIGFLNWTEELEEFQTRFKEEYSLLLLISMELFQTLNNPKIGFFIKKYSQETLQEKHLSDTMSYKTLTEFVQKVLKNKLSLSIKVLKQFTEPDQESKQQNICLDLEIFQQSLKVLNSLLKSIKGKQLLLFQFKDKQDPILKLNDLNKTFKYLLKKSEQKDVQEFATKNFIVYLDSILYSLINVVNISEETTSQAKTQVSILFAQEKDYSLLIDKLKEKLSIILSWNISYQEQLNLQLLVDSIERVIKSQPVDSWTDYSTKEEVNLVSRSLNEYTKGFYLYEKTLLNYVKGMTLSQFSLKGFQSLRQVLENKFQKITLPKTIFKQSYVADPFVLQNINQFLDVLQEETSYSIADNNSFHLWITKPEYFYCNLEFKRKESQTKLAIQIHQIASSGQALQTIEQQQQQIQQSQQEQPQLEQQQSDQQQIYQQTILNTQINPQMIYAQQLYNQMIQQLSMMDPVMQQQLYPQMLQQFYQILQQQGIQMQNQSFNMFQQV